jgi:hypothetical protein
MEDPDMRPLLFLFVVCATSALQAQTPSRIVKSPCTANHDLRGESSDRLKTLFEQLKVTQDAGECMRLAGLLKQEKKRFDSLMVQSWTDHRVVSSVVPASAKTEVNNPIHPQRGIQLYQVNPATKGNRIELVVANDDAGGLDNVTVQVLKSPRTFSFPVSHQILQSVPGSGQRQIVLNFDAGYPAEGTSAARDTLVLLLKDNTGMTWTREMIFEYAPPTSFQLRQNFPNPFNPSTTFRYELPVDSRVSLKVYDLLGRELLSLVDGQEMTGYHEVRLDGTRLSSGIYFCRMVAQENSGNSRHVQVRKLMVIK